MRQPPEGLLSSESLRLLNGKILENKNVNISDNFKNDNVQAFDDNEHNLRLPKSSIPLRYDLNLKTSIHVGNRIVNGDLTIHIRILEETNRLTLHTRNQNFHELLMFEADGTTPKEYSHASWYSPTDMLTIYFLDNENPGAEYHLKINYSFEMRESSSGFYQTNYTAADGATRFLGATQFEPTSARYAFPHYDEPSFKAVFNLSITHDESYHAIANMDGARTIK